VTLLPSWERAGLRSRLQNGPRSIFYMVDMKNGIARETVILVGMVRHGVTEPGVEENLEELAQLVRSAGGEVKAVAVQKKDRPTPPPSSAGARWRSWPARQDAPRQDGRFRRRPQPLAGAGAEERLDAKKVMDRPWLILSSSPSGPAPEEAKTQVSLAQYQYLLPRLAGRWTTSPQEGASG